MNRDSIEDSIYKFVLTMHEMVYRTCMIHRFYIYLYMNA